ncbi:hypothetical protein ACQP04_02535 [Pseudonocardia halophobica]|uniref:hypothetical protein n=1 Tax=Pseudonocardia halophobica TaxID=29401 RepID=UPI003D9202C2
MKTHTGGSTAEDGQWAPARAATTDEVVADHERNPEYELHMGRLFEADGRARRYVSLWLQGARYHGWLDAGEPRKEF